MVAVEEYLHTSYEPEMKDVDGRLVDRHVGEYFHSRVHRAGGLALETPLVGPIDFGPLFQEFDADPA